MATDADNRAVLETRMGSLETRMGNLETRMGSLETRMGSLEGRLGNLEGRVTELSQAVQDLRAGQRQILIAVLGLSGIMLAGLGGVIAALVALALQGG